MYVLLHCKTYSTYPESGNNGHISSVLGELTLVSTYKHMIKHTYHAKYGVHSEQLCNGSKAIPADSLKVDSCSQQALPYKPSQNTTPFLRCIYVSRIFNQLPRVSLARHILMHGGSDSPDYAIHYHQLPGSGGIRDLSHMYITQLVYFVLENGNFVLEKS